MKTTIYYFSATGNSLYTSRNLKKSLGAEIFSISEMLRKQDYESDAEKIGFVFPLHYAGLPILVEEYVRKLKMPQAKYVFAVATCGIPYLGRPFTDLNEILIEKNLDYQQAGICDWFQIICPTEIQLQIGVFVSAIGWLRENCRK